MDAIYLVLYILAFVCFIVAFVLRPIAGPPGNVWHPLKLSLIALGLALWVLVPIIQGLQTVSGK